MNINFISILLGCAGLLVGGFGLVAQDGGKQSTDHGALQRARAAWPPHAFATGVEFHDEMVELLTLGATPRARAAPPAQQAQGAPPEGDTNIRLIRTVRVPEARRTQSVEIVFVDRGGQSYLRRYPLERQALAAGDPRSELEADRSALETYGYSPRRSRRYGRGHYRRRW